MHPDIEATVLVPVTRLATSRARGVLPAMVPHADAALNAGRAALLVEALTRSPEHLFEATEDRLHQEYRSGVMTGSWELVRALRVEGLAATVSGRGRPSCSWVGRTTGRRGHGAARAAARLGPVACLSSGDRPDGCPLRACRRRCGTPDRDALSPTRVLLEGLRMVESIEPSQESDDASVIPRRISAESPRHRQRND
ncbi:hypothetical protein NKG05_21725 [Oerskovia sp. M15]